jgi:MFS family permease
VARADRGGRVTPRGPWRRRDFRLFWFAFLTTQTGSAMQAAALMWQVATLAPPGEQATALGVLAMTRLAPILILALVGGSLADRVAPRTILTATQAAAIAPAALLAAHAWSGLAALWPIYALSTVTATLGAFDAPARQVTYRALIEDDEVPRAVGLVMMATRGAQVLGPALAGVAITTLGLGAVYAINAASFVAAVAGIAAMRPASAAPTRDPTADRSPLAGLRFLFASPVLRAALLLDVAVSVFGASRVLLPIVALDVLEVGATGFGWLAAASPVGGAIAMIAMIRVGDRLERRGRALVLAALAYGLATVGLGLARHLGVALLCLVVAGGTDIFGTVIRGVLRHQLAPVALRGRVASGNQLFARVGPQVGDLEASLVAARFGVRASIVSGGIGATLIALAVALAVPALRREERRVAERGG